MSRFTAWLHPDTRASSAADTHDSGRSAGSTFLVIGLGNPGKQYERTRHNLGFMVVDELVRRTNATSPKSRNSAAVYETHYGHNRLILVKPQTFMNDSGRAVSPLMNWYKAPVEQVLIVVDDLDLPFAQIRIRSKGSAGGHNGLKSIFRETGTEAFPRLRLGIGRSQRETVDHVLSRFPPEQEKELPDLISRAGDTVELWLNRGILEAMNLTNGV